LHNITFFETKVPSGKEFPQLHANFHSEDKVADNFGVSVGSRSKALLTARNLYSKFSLQKDIEFAKNGIVFATLFERQYSYPIYVCYLWQHVLWNLSLPKV